MPHHSKLKSVDETVNSSGYFTFFLSSGADIHKPLPHDQNKVSKL